MAGPTAAAPAGRSREWLRSAPPGLCWGGRAFASAAVLLLTAFTLLAPCAHAAAPSNVAESNANAALPDRAEVGLLDEVERLDRRLATAEHHVAIAETNRRQAEFTLADAQAARAAAQLRYDVRSRSFARRLSAAMRATQGARLALLGGSADVSDYVDRQRLLAAVAAHDRTLWQQVREAKAELDAATVFAAQVRAQLEAHEADRRTLRDGIAQRRRVRSEKLRALRRDRAARLALRREQRAAVAQLGATIEDNAGATAGSFAGRHGALPWPAEGAVRRSFGQRVELTFGTATAHNGLDIAAPAGAPVQAVAPGRVVWADWLRGFGQVVIVEHGDGYHAIFAHLSRTQVARGERVAARQRLGLVGDTGSLRGTVLYFEIRRRGVPQDPLPWLEAGGS